MCCDFFELTDYHGAESLRRLPVEPGDLVLVDRGYNDRKAVGQIMDCGGELIMRYNSGAFPLLNPAGQPFDPLTKLRLLRLLWQKASAKGASRISTRSWRIQ
jgi:hypothetical protein